MPSWKNPSSWLPKDWVSDDSMAESCCWVDEHTTSVGVMVSAFAEENGLATIVGTNTPGRLLSGSAYHVGHGYILGLPVAAYLTWHGRMLENHGIVPKFSIELSRDALRAGKDTQLEIATEVAKAL